MNLDRRHRSTEDGTSPGSSASRRGRHDRDPPAPSGDDRPVFIFSPFGPTIALGLSLLVWITVELGDFMIGTVLFSMILLLIASNEHPDVSAIQGEKDQIEIQEFESPMILELAAVGLDNASFDEPWVVDNLSRFVCDDVSIRKMKFILRTNLRREAKGKPKTPHVSIWTYVQLHTRETGDRRVSLTIDLISKGDSILSWSDTGIKTDEGEVSNGRLVSPYMSKQAFDKAFMGEDEPKLKITMSVGT